MPAQILDNLPTEVMRIICTHLDHVHPQSVSSFASVSRRCHCAAAPFLYSTIKFSIRHHQDLALCVKECCRMLQRASSFHHLKRLIIAGCLGSNNVTEVQGNGDEWHHIQIERGLRNGDSDEDPLGAVLHRPEWGKRRLNSVVPTDNKAETDDSWRPLADLIERLPGLTDLVFGCDNQFPPNVLEAIHRHQLQCRLHIDTFQLPSLTASMIDKYDWILATSPCLYKVRVCYQEMEGFDNNNMPTYISEAVKDLVKGLAPNLKELQMVHKVPGAALWDSRPVREQWKGLRMGEMLNDHPMLGSLRSLSLRSYLPLTKETIEDWQACTDFSVLNNLAFRVHRIDGKALEYLGRSPCCFSSLTTLELNLMVPYRERRKTGQYAELVDRFLCNLPSLSTLALYGCDIPLSMSSLISHHGPRLRNLILDTYADSNPTHQIITHLSKECPLLETLSLCVNRSRGDATEVKLYKTLGSLPMLRNLALTLDASNRAVMGEDDGETDEDNVPETPGDPTFDEFDQQLCEHDFGGLRRPRNGHIRDALINSALDETLARNIFQAVSSGKPNGSCLQFQRLKVSTRGGGDLGDTCLVSWEFQEVLVSMEGSWKVERNPRDDSHHQLVVHQLGVSSQYHITNPDFKLPSWLDRVFRRIWPAQGANGGNWRHEWHSLPLSQTLEDRTIDGQKVVDHDQL